MPKSNEMIILNTPEQIAFYTLASTKAAVFLECRGMCHSRGVSVTALAKKRYGLKGNKASILAQLTTMVEKAIADKKAANRQHVIDRMLAE